MRTLNHTLKEIALRAQGNLRVLKSVSDNATANTKPHPLFAYYIYGTAFFIHAYFIQKLHISNTLELNTTKPLLNLT